MKLPVFINIALKEEWKPITFPDVIESRYYVSNYGRVYDCYKNSIIGEIGSSGYMIVRLDLKELDFIYCGTKTFSIQRLVMYEFNYFEDCLDYMVFHLDGVKTNNIISNLRWITARELAVYRKIKYLKELNY